MQEASAAQQWGEAVAEVAKGALPLSALAGLGARDLAQILSQAIAQMQIGRDAQALPILEVLVALDPENAIFHEYLGLALERLGRPDDAVAAYSANIAALTKLADADLRLCEAYLLRAQLHAQNGALDEATQDLTAAQQHDTGRDPELAAELKRLEQALRGGLS